MKMKALNKTENDAVKAGLTYGRYAQELYFAEHQEDRKKLKDMQPVYVKGIGKYLCPQCAHELELYRNCKSCGKVIAWKAGIKGKSENSAADI